jgi:uracil-DNA glycosylase
MARSCTPGRNCPRCPRLVAFRKTWRTREPGWFNAPVDSFGPRDARLLIVGLAPGLRGANRTGRPFTGDYAGDLLYATLREFAFAEGSYAASPDDGLTLRDCREFLVETIKDMTNIRAVVALGRIAHDTFITALAARRSAYPFAHGRKHAIETFALFDSYHCSRYNTNTGVLTPDMFRDVFAQVRHYLDAAPDAAAKSAAR